MTFNRGLDLIKNIVIVFAEIMKKIKFIFCAIRVYLLSKLGIQKPSAVRKYWPPLSYSKKNVPSELFQFKTFQGQSLEILAGISLNYLKR